MCCKLYLTNTVKRCVSFDQLRVTGNNFDWGPKKNSLFRSHPGAVFTATPLSAPVVGHFSQGLIRRFQPVIEERIAGGPELYQSEKEKYFQAAWSGDAFKNKVRAWLVAWSQRCEGGVDYGCRIRRQCDPPVGDSHRGCVGLPPPLQSRSFALSVVCCCRRSLGRERGRANCGFAC